MSWLARSIANSLRLDDDAAAAEYGDSPKPQVPPRNNLADHHFPLNNRTLFDAPEEVDLEDDRFDNVELANNSDRNSPDADDDDNQGRGVKEDLSEFTETLTRQLWGVASFLAPPPPPPPPPRPSRQIRPDTVQLDQIPQEETEAEDVEEDSGSYYYYSDSYYVEEEEGVEDAVGVTEEALAFAQNIAHHPETWLDFPLSEEEDFEEFEISDAQHKHALVVEHLAPGLAALRTELCPAHMTEGYFWMVYFVLLHSRLDKSDADMLSTPELVHARTVWRQELQKRTKADTGFGMISFYLQDSTHSPSENRDRELPEDSHSRYESHIIHNAESRPHHEPIYFETQKHLVECNENGCAENPSEKSRKELGSGPSANLLLQDYDDDEDDWLEQTEELEGYTPTGIVGNEEDVSFSDLEEDSNWNMPMKST